ncbi:MAG: hypothetical protein H0T42_03515 [Deltaproteobacteria bacterium]|nr:hypothetical protein [Deltaproteobacteria bacterium]
MSKLLGLLAIAAACGDNIELTPDALVIPPVVARCEEIPFPAAAFATAADFGPIAPGTLAGWDPEGRWTLTGVRVGGVSSFHFEARGSEVIVDRDEDIPGTFTSDAIFQRIEYATPEGPIVVAKRVSDLQADGSLRADRAVCEGDACVVCTAKLVRATRNEGEGESNNLALVGELRSPSWGNGFTFNVRVAGTLAYLIRIDGLHIIETSDPANPVEVGSWQRAGDGYSNDVKIVEANNKRYALIADTPVDVVDVTDPTMPRLVAQIPEEAHTLFTETRGGKQYAYFGNYDGTCPMFDITNPEAPVRLSRFTTAGSSVHDLMVKDGIAYLNAWDAGLYIVDFTTPGTPVEIGRAPITTANTSHSSWATIAGGRKVVLHGGENYGAHLDVLDADPSSPRFTQKLGSYTTRDHVSIHNVMAIGDRAYFTYYQDGVRVVSLADPTQPTLLGYFNTWDPQGPAATNRFFEGAVGLDVDPARKLIFVADSPRGLLILRDETP